MGEKMNDHLKLYVSGFVMSIVLTIIPFGIVMTHTLSGWELTTALFASAIMQLLVQLIFFLHLNRESKPRWNLLVGIFAAITVLIIVVGSLWIMNNLNYNMNASQDIIKDEGIKTKE